MQPELRPQATVPTLAAVLNELVQHQRQVQVLQVQLEQMGRMNNHLFMMAQQMSEQAGIFPGDYNGVPSARAEQRLTSLEQLVGYVLQQRAQVQHLRSEFKRLRVEIANQQQVLLIY